MLMSVQGSRCKLFRPKALELEALCSGSTEGSVGASPINSTRVFSFEGCRARGFQGFGMSRSSPLVLGF